MRAADAGVESDLGKEQSELSNGVVRVDMQNMNEWSTTSEIFYFLNSLFLPHCMSRLPAAPSSFFDFPNSVSYVFLIVACRGEEDFKRSQNLSL